MKEFFINHPYLTGLVVFLLIMIGGVSCSVIATKITYNPNLDDPHGLGAGLLITLALGASLVFGILSGLITTYFLLEKAKANKMP
jgi:hypothetical protein